MVKPEVLFEDEYLLVVAKPFGWVVNRSATQTNNLTLQDWVEAQRWWGKVVGDSLVEEEEDPGDREFVNRSGIVHRLDKDTSGALLIAKNPEVFAGLQLQFKERQVGKEYQTLVYGDASHLGDRFEIAAPVGRNPRNRMRFAVTQTGRPAKTVLAIEQVARRVAAVKGRPKIELYTLLKASPWTGRTHQIRVHLKSVNHPVVADPLYAGRKQFRASQAWCPRLFLHAARLTFKHPVSLKSLTVVSPLPTELVSAWESLTAVN